MNGCYVIGALSLHCQPLLRILDQPVVESHRLRSTPRVDVNHVHESQVVGEDGVVVQELDLESGVQCILLHEQFLEEGGRHACLTQQVLAMRNVLPFLIRL